MSELSNVIDLKCRLITSIESYILEQKELWRQIPAAAEIANKSGHSTILKLAVSEKLWTINPQGDYRHLLYVRCDGTRAGEIINEHYDSVSSHDMLRLIECLDMLSAKAILAQLEAKAKAPETAKSWHAHDDERAVLGEHIIG